MLLCLVIYVKNTAVFATPADASDATKRLAIFLGRDLKTNGTGHRSYLEASFEKDGAKVKVVVIDRGFGSGQVAEGYLHFGNIDTPANFYHNQTEAVQKALKAKLKLENGFKIQRQVKPLLAVV